MVQLGQRLRLSLSTRRRIFDSVTENRTNCATYVSQMERVNTQLTANTVLQTGVVSSASGSAYFELEVPKAQKPTVVPSTSTIKLSCAVHGPKPLPRNASFSPNLQLTASVKYAPFATRVRRGYIRDPVEKDLSVHLENALQGVIIPDRWPKSALDVAVAVLEGEDNEQIVPGQPLSSVTAQVGLMNILAGCITVATAALIDAKIDCLDMMAGGVAASMSSSNGDIIRILDPAPYEHQDLKAACVVGYLPGRDEITEIWTTGETSEKGAQHVAGLDDLTDSSVSAAKAVHNILKDVIIEAANREMQNVASEPQEKSNDLSESNDVEMKT
jgi:exosome complex component MTR3